MKAKAKLQPTSRQLTVTEICASLVEKQALRRDIVKTTTSIVNRRHAIVKRTLGYDADMPEAERKKIMAKSDKIIGAILDGETPPEVLALPAFVSVTVHVAEESLSPWKKQRDEVEAEMRELAEQLPVWPWVEQVRGVSSLGLAVIVGETGEDGNIGLYRTVSGFWKRHGLAVIDGQRQRKCTNKEEAERHGYSPARRAENWAFIGDIMLRAQWRAGKNGDAGTPLGKYGEVYAVRKAYELTREKMTPKHADNSARRIMTKAFLKDLYLAWQEMTSSEVQ